MSPMRDSERRPGRRVSPVLVHLPDGRTQRFTEAFHIGREHDCELQIEDVHVSRRHAFVSPDLHGWTIRDLQSRNGLFVNGQRIETAEVGDGLDVIFGDGGPAVTIEPEPAAPQFRAATASRPKTASQPASAEHYFGAGSEDEGEVGERTMMIREAFQRIQKQQKRRHRWVVSAVAIVGLLAAGYGLYAYLRLKQQEDLARDVFYSMKGIDVEIARTEMRLASSGDAAAQAQLTRARAQRRQTEAQYDKFANSIYDRRLSEKDRLILRVTRRLGECELVAPPEYLREVSRFIAQWQATRRYQQALKRAQDLGYTRRIVDAFAAQDLPPQFFYLAMQESNFVTTANGPRTRWGIAKGMWQFIPETGRRFGLTIGSAAEGPRNEPGDERLDWQKATVAASRYIKDLYTTDAQASALLVMASYNWGERRVIDLVKTLPDNPQERNFWKLLARYRIPDETYNYVFNIVAAAVIGENPRLFGFPFDNPLESVDQTIPAD